VQDFVYYWQNDRLSCLDEKDEKMMMLPGYIKKTIFSHYVFADIFMNNQRLFTVTIMKNTEFLYAMSRGMVPRFFLAEDPEDSIIYEEEQEVSEMFFIIDGFVGVGFQVSGLPGLRKNSIFYGKKQAGNQLLCDHYVINKSRSNFLYVAIKDTNGYGISKSYLHE
jgi:hypothetical protein